MFERLILKIAYKILDKKGGSTAVNGIYLVRMSNEFYEWIYSKGYKIFEEKQKQKEDFAKSMREMNYKHNYLL